MEKEKISEGSLHNNMKEIEYIPKEEDAVYRNIKLCQLSDDYIISIEIEEDLLVPDTEPDIESILSGDGEIKGASLTKGDHERAVEGRVRLEVIYRSTDPYSTPINILAATVNFREVLGEGVPEGEKAMITCSIRKADFRIINERKYKVKLQCEAKVHYTVDKEYKIFDEIKNEPLEIKKEKIKICNVTSTRECETEINDELQLGDERIRPVKIMASRFFVSENHRQITREKLILNQTLQVRILYMAEMASKGNVHNQPMYFCGKIDITQFQLLGKANEGAEECRIFDNRLELETGINQGATGFTVKGKLKTNVEFLKTGEEEMVTDFYHIREDMEWDENHLPVCGAVKNYFAGCAVAESVPVEDVNLEGMRILYAGGRVTGAELEQTGNGLQAKGKIMLEAVAADEENKTAVVKKICEFACVVEATPDPDCSLHIEQIEIKDISAEIAAGNKINFTAGLSVNVMAKEMGAICLIGNPCIVRGKDKEKIYPITVHTVGTGETLWDIGKNYKVPESSITMINGPDCAVAGEKIVIAK